MASLLGNLNVTMDTNQTTTRSTTTDEPRTKGTINAALVLFGEYLKIEISAGVALLGIINNVLIIIVFAKMGYKETANISMTAIAIWNLIRCLASGFYPIMNVLSPFIPYVGSWYLITDYITGNFMVYPSGFVSGVISAFVAIERCVCVARPFLVKSWFTPRSVTIWCVSISILVPLSYSTKYLESKIVKIVWGNITFLTLATTGIFYKSRILLDIKVFLNQFYPMATITITSVCSIIIVYHLKRSAKFRSEIKTAGSGSRGAGQLSPRDRQVVKMLLLVLLVYIVCSLPTVLIYFFDLALPDWDELDHLRFLKKYNETLVVFGFLVDSSVNIFIFFSMSSQFNKTMRKMLCLPRKAK